MTPCLVGRWFAPEKGSACACQTWLGAIFDAQKRPAARARHPCLPVQGCQTLWYGLFWVSNWPLRLMGQAQAAIKKRVLGLACHGRMGGAAQRRLLCLRGSCDVQPPSSSRPARLRCGSSWAPPPRPPGQSAGTSSTAPPPCSACALACKHCCSRLRQLAAQALRQHWPRARPRRSMRCCTALALA